MPIAAIMAAINAAMTLIPIAVSAGASIIGVVENVKKLTSTDPNAVTQADLDALQAENDKLRDEVTVLEDRD